MAVASVQDHKKPVHIPFVLSVQSRMNVSKTQSKPATAHLNPFDPITKSFYGMSHTGNYRTKETHSEKRRTRITCNRHVLMQNLHSTDHPAPEVLELAASLRFEFTIRKRVKDSSNLATSISQE